MTSTLRTAGCGPACPVVWEGAGGESFSAALYPDRECGISGGLCLSLVWIRKFQSLTPHRMLVLLTIAVEDLPELKKLTRSVFEAVLKNRVRDCCRKLRHSC